MKVGNHTYSIPELMKQGKAYAKAGKFEKAEEIKAEIESRKAEEAALKDNHTVPEMLWGDHKMGEEINMGNLDATSTEYRNAFLKHISGRDDQMTKLENEAFVHTTQNTPNVLPVTMADEIWDLVSKNHVIMDDVTIYRTGTILEVAKHTEIVQGKAKKVAEGTANDDEQNDFVKVTLSGNDFSKSVEISYAEAAMSLDALEKYLVTEISNSIGEALAEDVVANAIEANINVANKIAVTGNLKFADVAKAFGALKRVADPVVYCTRATLYTALATLENTAGQLIYQPSATVGVPGTLMGAEVKIEDAVAGGKLLIGDGKRVVYNMIQDVLIETDKDIKTHKYIYSGYARGEGALVDDKSFSEITIG